MIKTINKDILTVTEGVIGHQVNCRGKMGSGLAKQIRLAYPEVFLEYNALCEGVHELERYTLLGTTQIVETNKNEGLKIANIFGQLSTSKTSRETEYCALHLGLLELLTKVPADCPIYLPFNIGCGRGGGDWNIVHNILTRVFNSAKRDLILCKYETPE